MVRAPCCAKMGLKKGPWSQEEDAILVSYIRRHGHENWRALPKQAGLLRCGKSCRLRWMNYLRPDVKRGNFTEEEEDMIISLHEMLGNRWSAIAARLPGRTDNEIKNVWHTHLKKRLDPAQPVEKSKKQKVVPQSKVKTKKGSELPAEIEIDAAGFKPNEQPNSTPTHSMSQKSGSVSSCCTGLSCSGGNDSSIATQTNEMSNITSESMDFSYQEFSMIDESFWNEALCMDNFADVPMNSPAIQCEQFNDDEDVNYWLRFFMEAGEFEDLPDV